MQKSLIKQIGIVILVTFLILVRIFFYRERQLTADTRHILNEAKQQMGMMADISYSSLSANIFTDTISISNFKMVPKVGGEKIYPVIFDRISYRYQFDKTKRMLNSLKLDVEGLHTTLDPLALGKRKDDLFWQNVVDAMGAQDLLVDMHLTYVYKPVAHQVLVKLQQNFRGLGKLGIGIILTNIPTSLGSGEQMLNVELQQLRVQYNDEKFLPLVFNAIAAKQGITKKELIAKIQTELDEKIGLTQDPLMIAIYQQFKLFVEKPQQLIIDSSPATPLSFIEIKLTPPAEILDKLKIKIKAN